MMNSLYYLLMFSFMFSVSVFVFHSVNLMNMLLLMELMFLNIYIVMSFYLGGFIFSSLLFFLVLGVCEGAMGLTLVIVLIRTFGNVMMKSMDLSLC